MDSDRWLDAATASDIDLDDEHLERWRDAYDGPARLVRSDATEVFHTTHDGEPKTEHPELGEPVWRDDVGVTCRRWNWRQTHRTAITLIESTDLAGTPPPAG